MKPLRSTAERGKGKQRAMSRNIASHKPTLIRRLFEQPRRSPKSIEESPWRSRKTLGATGIEGEFITSLREAPGAPPYAGAPGRQSHKGKPVVDLGSRKYPPFSGGGRVFFLKAKQKFSQHDIFQEKREGGGYKWGGGRYFVVDDDQKVLEGEQLQWVGSEMIVDDWIAYIERVKEKEKKNGLK
ncbi:hypothetical protein CEXT_582191 [Caerostris extrusa]|uniref:Uncharacterized protein n=1 Tax=Caerostris extrusa TaxID=172846 RepID=A0AAV4MBM4_CAEEX|nr:hypothetical protein CEXT_582191 [Caerostris extrusa]